MPQGKVYYPDNHLSTKAPRRKRREALKAEILVCECIVAFIISGYICILEQIE